MNDDSHMPPPDDPLQPGADPFENDEDLDISAPAVAAAPGKLFLYIFLGGAVVYGLFWYLFIYDSGSGDDDSGHQSSLTVMHDPSNIPAPAPAPEPLPPPKPLALPAPPPPVVSTPLIGEEEPTDEERLKRLRSSMLVFEGGDGVLGLGEEEEDRAGAEFASTDPNLTFARRAMRASASEKAKAGHIGDMYSTIAQGKLVHAVLETAINTQLPGSVRAIVSRDTYAEAGRVRLIPKGSRLIGVYNTEIFRGQERVFIIWTRVIRPDGTDMFIASAGVDQLGRAGLKGFVDSKFTEIFTSAILTSMITIGVAVAAEEITGDDEVTTTTNTDGSTTTNGTATARATLQAVGQIGSVGRRMIDGMIDMRPTITIDQGTKVNVFVNRDLIFPRVSGQQVRFIP